MAWWPISIIWQKFRSCDKIYIFCQNLKPRYQANHQGYRITCPECGLKIESNVKLKSHLEEYHSNSENIENKSIYREPNLGNLVIEKSDFFLGNENFPPINLKTPFFYDEQFICNYSICSSLKIGTINYTN